ncbi:helix-turn-helix domain-containing protein (plasmid) [Rhizobium leguminosarum]
MPELAHEAALPRSSFFEKFKHTVGVAPLKYLVAWRLVIAKDLLRSGRLGLAEIAGRVGYSSASASRIAFTRHAGLPPSQFVMSG